MADRIIINVGRQYGSGGKLVAEALGKKLGIKVFDNELISEAAEQSGFSKSLFSKSDEKKSNLHIGNLFGSNRYGSSAGNMLSDSELFTIQSKVIRKIAAEGNAIFIGRASDYVLRDLDCIDVFVCSPDHVRAERVSERLGISIEEAMIEIRKRDKRRQEYYNFFTFSHWGEASNYDICIDSSILGIDGTADMIIDFGKKRGYLK